MGLKVSQSEDGTDVREKWWWWKCASKNEVKEKLQEKYRGSYITSRERVARPELLPEYKA
jgi:hypothetical protein